MLKAEIARRIRALLSGSPTGTPEWTPLVEAGNDAGMFAPTDAAWIVHADVATMIGGVRALLLQAMHPGSLAGVMEHSRYEEDALGRLAGTIRWLTMCTFASIEAVEVESARVRGMHEKVRGAFTENSGATRRYSASDADLLTWVHLAFTDSFLASHLRYGKKQIPGGADAYISQWGNAVRPLGVASPAVSLAELQAQLREFEPQLRVDERTLRVVSFIRRPPSFKGFTRLIYAVLFAAAYHMLSDKHQRDLQQKVMPNWLAQPLATFAMHFLRFVLGPNSPLEDAALKRRARLT